MRVSNSALYRRFRDRSRADLATLSRRLPAMAEQGASASNGAAVIQLLRESRLIADAQIAEAKLVTEDLSGRLWETLLDMGHLDGDKFFALMSKQPGVALFDLRNYNVPSDVAELVSPELVKSGMVFPVDKLGKMLSLGMACPVDGPAIAAVERETGLKIKVMLCRLNDIRKTIQTFYPAKRPPIPHGDAFAKEMSREFDETINDNKLAERIYDQEPFGPLKKTVAGLSTIGRRGAGAVTESLKLVSRDPAAVALVLSVANSAAYGFARRVDNIELACSLLGAEAVYDVVSAVPPADPGASGFDISVFVKRARYCSEASRKIAQACESQRVVTAHTSGMVFELGRLAMLKALPRSYSPITQGKWGSALLGMEKRIYGITHADMGYMVSRKSNLPPGMTEPMRFLHRPAEAIKFKEVVSIVSLAARATEAANSGTAISLEGAEAALESLELSQGQVAGACSALTF